uniref:CHCH domain-containing protein n=1 Tax=Pseudo-nitzschia australis TaxID=44445 RepID=A0A6U9V793_9STRA|mmetsp:Transcript_27100/g.59607  ORF Transcript_27100/g.59607 Transcript_27100/m.59607 type:complete len:123 (-) Transcript_27100:729-1097(-)
MNAASVDDIDPATGKAIRDKIRSDINPGNNAGLKHNSGKPKEAPYASTNDEADPRDKAATYLTNCAKQSRASLACIERNYQNRAACNEFFQAYKECRKEENEQRKAANAKENGDGGSGGWFW